MSHNLFRISRLRDEYDRRDVEVLELRSPSSEDRLSDPRDQEADRKAFIYSDDNRFAVVGNCLDLGPTSVAM